MDARGSKLYGVELSSFGQISTPKEAENPDEDFGGKAIADFQRRRVSRLLADAGFDAALNTLRELQKDPGELGEGLLIDVVPALAALVVGKNARKRSWESLWTFGTGKTWKSLREFPGRLRRMAGEVERLNKSQSLLPRARDPVENTSCQFC